MHGRVLPNLAAVIGREPAWVLHCLPRGQGFNGYEQIVKSGARHMAAQRDSAFFSCRRLAWPAGRRPIAQTCIFMMSVYARTNWLRTASVA
jgi:hypothetical protein